MKYTYQMIRTLLAVFVLTVFSASAYAEIAKSNPLTVYDLKKDGWRIVKKNSYVEVRPGTNFYSNLKRYVQVVVYSLQRKEKHYKCILEYDSQNDVLIEECMKL